MTKTTSNFGRTLVLKYLNAFAEFLTKVMGGLDEPESSQSVVRPKGRVLLLKHSATWNTNSPR